MKISTGLGLTAAITLAFGTASSADSRSSKKQSQGYGYVTSQGVWLARVKPVEKLLKGDCGLRLTDIVGVQSNRGGFGGRSRRCDPNKKEKQKFHVVKMRPGENFEVAARTQGVVSSGSFNNRQRVGLGTFKGDSRSCYSVVTYKGKKLVQVPVRSGRRDQYLFSNPLAANANALNNAKAESKRLTDVLAKNRKDYNIAMDTLEYSRAYNKSSKQCFMPSRRALPRKPTVMSYKNANYHAHGHCINRLKLIWTGNEVTDALLVDDMYTEIDTHTKWRRAGTRPPSCAISAAKRAIPEVGVGVRSIFNFGTVTLKRNQIQTDAKKCFRAVRNSCRAGLSSWQSQVNSINSEPRRTYNSCQSALRKSRSIINRNSADSRALKAAQARERSVPTQARQIDLANARCGSTL